MERVARACLRNLRASAKQRLAFIHSVQRADSPMNRRYLKDECNGSRVPAHPEFSPTFQSASLYNSAIQ